jgi:hypothetical protein
MQDSMTIEQEAHLAGLKAQAMALMDSKYRLGVKEHGGNLWDLTPKELVLESILEAVDQLQYLITAYDRMSS